MSAIAAITCGKSSPGIISTSTATFGASNSVTINYPTGGALGNLLLSIGFANNASAVTWSCAGTTRINQGAKPSLFIADQIDAGSISDTNLASASVSIADAAMVRIGLATLDVIGTIATATADGVLSAPAVTSAGGLLLAIFVCDGTGSAVTFSTPTGFQVVLNTFIAGMPCSIFSKPVSAGATGAVSSNVAGITAATAACILYGVK